ncbi:MAG: URC4/urg3 family protein [Pseudomonadota bacterium]|nr:URC4/urg3 family protein [Pseudomonadota bacterium]
MSAAVVSRAQAERAAEILRTTHTIRERCGQLLARARAGDSPWWSVNDDRIAQAAHAVSQSIRERYPKLHIPFHSRWRHFEAGGVDRRARLEQQLVGQDPTLRAKAMIDLTVVSVLLDAGAGAEWKYVEPASGQTFSRSEGLGIASFHAFMGGLFSSDKERPLQADAVGLRAINTDHLASVLQVSHSNPMVGLEGRAVLLRRLGEAMAEQPEVFGEDGRPGGLFDMLVTPHGSQVPHTADISAHDILSQLLMTLSAIWPSANNIGGVALGDCWRHSAVRGEGASDGWVPFHKLSQWLTYSLLEPFAWAGVNVRGADALTGLPEYRNGGLLMDTEVLALEEPANADTTWLPGDELIVEWRALTVALLDEVAMHVRSELKMDEQHLPLARVLEGGTWAAGRALSQRLRGGLPPLKVTSDGTVF